MGDVILRHMVKDDEVYLACSDFLVRVKIAEVVNPTTFKVELPKSKTDELENLEHDLENVPRDSLMWAHEVSPEDWEFGKAGPTEEVIKPKAAPKEVIMPKKEGQSDDR